MFILSILLTQYWKLDALPCTWSEFAIQEDLVNQWAINMIWAIFLPDKMHHLSLLTLQVLILLSAHTPWLPVDSSHLPGIFFLPLQGFPGSCGPGTCTTNSCFWLIFKLANQANYRLEHFIFTELSYHFFMSLCLLWSPLPIPNPLHLQKEAV